MRRVLPFAVGLAIALTGAALRSVHLSADPPYSIEIHSPFSIEGHIVHNARARVLEGLWRPDEWDMTALGAAPTWLSAASFALFGTGLEGARIPSVALSFLSLLLLHGILRRCFDPRAAALGALFFATNYAAAMIGRLALPAPYVTAFALLTIWLWGWPGRPAWGAALAGISSAAALTSDPMGLALPLAAAGFTILARLHAWKMTWRDALRVRLRTYWAAFAAAMLLWAVFLLLPRWHSTLATFRYTNPFQAGFGAAVRAFFFAPHELGELFRFFPVTFLVIAVYSLFLSREVMRLVARHRPVSHEKLWLFSWFMAGLVFAAALPLRPMRSLVFLVPPLVAFAADGLVRLHDLRRIERTEIGFPVFFFWETTLVWFGAQWAFRSWALRPGAAVPGFFLAHANRWEFAAVTSLSLLISFVVVLTYRRWRHSRFGIPVPKAISVAAALLAVAAILATDLVQYERWRRSPVHAVLEAQSAIAALPEGSAVAGTWAPLLCLPSRHRALMYRDGMNDEPLSPLGVRYLLSETGALEEIARNPVLSRVDPGAAGRARLLRTFRLGSHQVELHEVGPVAEGPQRP
jgi:4-amino-4-deoxy-L-arabinose transferase-like glycosyltransferase